MNVNRNALLSLLALVRPALAAQSFIPAWTHVLFAGGSVTTYDDTMSITVKSKDLPDVERCLPGELLIKTLNSFNASDVALQEGEHEFLLSSGRSKIKIPVLDAEEFKLPSTGSKNFDTIELDDEILDGIKLCLNAVGTDPTHAAQMGVTLGDIDGKAVLYSTDNVTISRFKTKCPIKLPGDSPIILPTRFCNQLLVMGKAYPDSEIKLQVFAGALRAKFGESASLMHKTLVDTEALDFETHIENYFEPSNITKLGGYSAIPNALDAAFNRALLVQGDEPDKRTEVEVTKEEIVLTSKSKMAHADDEIEWDGKMGLRKPFNVNPTEVLRGIKISTHIAFFQNVMVTGSKDGNFLHLITHVQ